LRHHRCGRLAHANGGDNGEAVKPMGDWNAFSKTGADLLARDRKKLWGKRRGDGTIVAGK
jgi:hypothetical protein